MVSKSKLLIIGAETLNLQQIPLKINFFIFSTSIFEFIWNISHGNEIQKLFEFSYSKLIWIQLFFILNGVKVQTTNKMDRNIEFTTNTTENWLLHILNLHVWIHLKYFPWVQNLFELLFKINLNWFEIFLSPEFQNLFEFYSKFIWIQLKY